MKKYVLIFLTLSLVLIGAWQMVFSQNKTTNTPQPPKGKLQTSGVISVSAEKFNKLAQNQENFLLDVHIPEQTHIPGTDAFIPYNQIDKNINNLPPDKNTPILVYCRSGSMSRQASEKLVSLGYSKVYDLTGGINAYKQVDTTIAITPKTQDLGTVVYGDVAQTIFTITNFTPDPLKITRVSTSCGCTSAAVVKDNLQPYEETTVNVSFDPAVHKDDTDLGDITRTIYIETDNINFSALEVNITATVVKKK